MDQWQGYSDAAGGRRYNGGSQLTPGREYGQQPPQVQPPVGFKYDQYQGGLSAHSSQQSATSPINTPQLRDGNGDVPMQDAHDPYSAMKYPMRPHHQSHISGGRAAGLHSPSEPSAAAQRYSPMEVLSPASSYGSKSAANQAQFAAALSQRQSPTRADYPSQSPYYGRQTSQLPPITPYVNSQENYPSSAVTPLDGTYANDPKSPRRTLQPTVNIPVEKKPVPQFKKLGAVTDLRPKVNSQPAFRRANPEGGFISV